MSIELDGDLHLINTIYTGPGHLQLGEEKFRKSRLWILEDRTVVACVPAPDDSVDRRNLGSAESVEFRGRRNLTVTIPDYGGPISFQEADCACGMGEVGTAAPIQTARWRIVRVRRPDWITEI